MTTGDATPPTAASDIFATTHWTVVLAAGHAGSPQAVQALEELCRTYWFPLYAYARRRGLSREDAEDVTQEFFARVAGKNSFARLRSERGKFRAFLLASLKHFLANERDKRHAAKRGCGRTNLSMDWQSADTQFQVAATNEPSPDKAFDREWALALLGQVVNRLQAECAADGKGRLFEHLKCFLTVEQGRARQAEAAGALGMEEGAVRVAVHRLRKRYRQLLRDEIARTLADPAMVEEELRALFGAFS